MPLTMSQIAVPADVRGLGNLAVILDRGVAYAAQKGFDPQVLFNARLAPDMHPLSTQVQFVSDGARGCVARLAGIAAPKRPYAETSFDELKARLAWSREFVQSVPAADIDAGETRQFTVSVQGTPTDFVGRDYLFTFALPNLHFHTTAAYAILRHNGAPVGKLDFLGPY